MHFKEPSRFRKGQLISIQKISRKQKMNKYFAKKIRRLVNWWFDVTNKLLSTYKNIFSECGHLDENCCHSAQSELNLY